MGYFEDRKKEILVKLKTDIKYHTDFINWLFDQIKIYPELKSCNKNVINRKELQVIQLEELYRKINRLEEDI